MRSTDLIVLSGGIDSVTLAFELKESGKNIRAIYLDTGYLPAMAERNSAKMTANLLEIPIEIVDVQGIIKMVSGFVPTEDLGLGELDKGEPKPIEPDDEHVVGFPVLLSMASYFALLGKIENVNVAIVKEQIDHNPGLSGFLTSWAETIGPLNPSRTLSLSAPYSDISKSEVVKRGSDLGIDYRNTWSCYRGAPIHCGGCGGCTTRKTAFKQAGVTDPTAYSV